VDSGSSCWRNNFVFVFVVPSSCHVLVLATSEMTLNMNKSEKVLILLVVLVSIIALVGIAGLIGNVCLLTPFPTN